MDFIADVVAGRVQLPTIARVVQQLIAGLGRRDANLARIAADLAEDPVLSASVLRLANSAFYGGQRRLAGIDEAVATIGTDALRNLVLTCGVSAAFVEVPGVDLAQFWRESVVAATATRALLRHAGASGHAVAGEQAEGGYVAGLLRASGHLILCQAHPVAAKSHFGRHRNLRGAALAEQESALFGVAHPAVSALWVDRLGFPAEVGQAIRDSLAPVSDTTTALDAAVRLGGALAADALAGVPFEQAAATCDDTLLARLDASVDRRASRVPRVLRAREEAFTAAFAEPYAAWHAIEWKA